MNHEHYLTDSCGDLVRDGDGNAIVCEGSVRCLRCYERDTPALKCRRCQRLTLSHRDRGEGWTICGLCQKAVDA